MRSAKYLTDELAHWPTVQHESAHRGRHKAVVVKHGDQTRNIFYSGTSVERRAVLNCITNARRVLRAMGARRDDE